jgi:hypothetical protein
LQIRSKQELQLRARNFLPPQSLEPEMFLLDRLGSLDPARLASFGMPGEFADADGERRM